VGKGPRSIDPVLVGNRETDAWVAYYRRDWRRFLVASVGLVSAGFGMNPVRTLRGAWFVLRANQVWAPIPDNQPELAREYMRERRAARAGRVVHRSPPSSELAGYPRPPAIGRSRWATPGPPYG
jgi:hypothetical protein